MLLNFQNIKEGLLIPQSLLGPGKIHKHTDLYDHKTKCILAFQIQLKILCANHCIFIILFKLSNNWSRFYYPLKGKEIEAWRLIWEVFAELEFEPRSAWLWTHTVDSINPFPLLSGPTARLHFPACPVFRFGRMTEFRALGCKRRWFYRFGTGL